MAGGQSCRDVRGVFETQLCGILHMREGLHQFFMKISALVLELLPKK